VQTFKDNPALVWAATSQRCSCPAYGSEQTWPSPKLSNLQVHEKRVTCVSDFNLQNGSSTLNTGRPQLMMGGGYSPEKLDLAAITAQKLGLPLRLPKVPTRGLISL
jgi:hypothetical protein